MFYVLLEPDDRDNTCLISDDDCKVIAFATEEAAIEASKEYNGTMDILKPVARITEKTTRKITKIK